MNLGSPEIGQMTLSPHFMLFKGSNQVFDVHTLITEYNTSYLYILSIYLIIFFMIFIYHTVLMVHYMMIKYKLINIYRFD